MAAMLGALRALMSTAGITLGRRPVALGDRRPRAAGGRQGRPPGPGRGLQECGRVGGDRILIGEGWNELWVMSMGTMVFTIELTSARGGTHTTYVPFDENPIRFVGDLIQPYYSLPGAAGRGRVAPFGRHRAYRSGDMVEAGDYFNRTPVQCRLTGTVRWGRARPRGGGPGRVTRTGRADRRGGSAGAGGKHVPRARTVRNACRRSRGAGGRGRPTASYTGTRPFWPENGSSATPTSS